MSDPIDKEAEAAFCAEYPNCAERMKLEPHVVEFHDAWVEGFCFRAARSAAPVAPNAALRAVRILDAWAVKHGVMAPAPCFHWFTSKVDGAPLPRWRIFNGLQAVGGSKAQFTTADEARIAAADALVAADPELEPVATSEPKPEAVQPTDGELIAAIRVTMNCGYEYTGLVSGDGAMGCEHVECRDREKNLSELERRLNRG